MPKTTYTRISEIDEEQTKIMRIIDVWVHKKKTPMPLKIVISEMGKLQVKDETTKYSLKILIKKGYIRRAYTISNKTYFVQLRRV